MPSSSTLKFTDGPILFRPRLILSLLSHKPILILNIRPSSLTSPGLNENEISFLHLLDKLTNGTKIEINSTGTQLRFVPGVLLGGKHQHTCPNSRSTGYFLEGIIPLAPFGKVPLELTLEGITDGLEDLDPSPDYFKESILPLLPQFGIGTDDDYPPPQIKISKRGAAPQGGGQVSFFCPIVKELTSINYTDVGKIKRVRGTAISCRINPSSPARVAHSAKGVLHRLLPDVWIHTDTHTGSSKHKKLGCGPSPGLKVYLVAESTTGIHISAETCLNTSKERGKELPEDLGKRCSVMLLEEIRKGGCIDTYAQGIALLFMALSPEDVSRLKIGMLSHYTIGVLRLIKDVLGVEFKAKKVEEEDETGTSVMMSCLGSGYRNMARAST